MGEGAWPSQDARAEPEDFSYMARPPAGGFCSRIRASTRNASRCVLAGALLAAALAMPELAWGAPASRAAPANRAAPAPAAPSPVPAPAPARLDPVKGEATFSQDKGF